jgi:hypothetical protein
VGDVVGAATRVGVQRGGANKVDIRHQSNAMGENPGKGANQRENRIRVWRGNGVRRIAGFWLGPCLGWSSLVPSA